MTLPGAPSASNSAHETISTAEPSHGSRLGLLSAAVLPLGLPEALKDGPGDVAAAAFRDYKADSPERVWTAPMAARTGQVRGRA